MFNLTGDDELNSEAWGIKAQLVVSAAHLFVYNLLILVAPVVFYGWWLSKHPDALQDASVPLTIIVGLLTLFWTMTGLLPYGRR
jgi:amino acid transporter